MKKMKNCEPIPLRLQIPIETLRTPFVLGDSQVYHCITADTSDMGCNHGAGFLFINQPSPESRRMQLIMTACLGKQVPFLFLKAG